VQRSDGFDLKIGETKVGSFQTGVQADGTREMYVFGPDVKLHFGAEVVESVLHRTFARASNTAGGEKAYAGPRVIRGERSTEALATFVVTNRASDPGPTCVGWSRWSRLQGGGCAPPRNQSVIQMREG